jgi:dihydrolipoamide dehydrogenase
MKFVAHAKTRELLGAQLMCEHASDMIGGVSQAQGGVVVGGA